MKTEFPLFVKKVKCPRHYILIAGRDPYVMERNPALKNIKEADAKIFGVKLRRRKKDINGKWILNRSSFYQPEMSAAFFLESVYDSRNVQCQFCRRCLNRI